MNLGQLYLNLQFQEFYLLILSPIGKRFFCVGFSFGINVKCFHVNCANGNSYHLIHDVVFFGSSFFGSSSRTANFWGNLFIYFSSSSFEGTLRANLYLLSLHDCCRHDIHGSSINALILLLMSHVDPILYTQAKFSQ